MSKKINNPSQFALELNSSTAKALFLGNAIENNLYPFPEINSAEKETLGMVLDSIDKFMQENDKHFAEFDEKGYQSDQYLQGLRELGLFGLIIPEEFGGIGLSNTAYSRVLQQTTRYDGSTSLTIGAHSSIGLKGLLLFGTPEQKKKYLPRLATGEMIAAFCLTEPGAGSDAASIKTTATKNSDGSWTLNGSKLWITNGGIADFFTVFARTDSEKGKITAFIVERAFTGLTNGPKENKLGIRASITTTVTFNDVKIPAENVLGEEGHGFRVAMSILNNGRTGLGGGAVGGMKRCIELAVKQSTERKQFGKKINEFGLVKEKISQMTVDCFATECVVAMVGHYIDSGHTDYSTEAAISKIFASEALWRTANEALQIAGGNGFMKDFPYEKIMRDSRINMIFEGTNEILRLFVAMSGLKDAGEYLKDLGKGISNIFNDPIKGFGVLSSYAAKKVSHLTPLGRDTLGFVHESLKPQAAILEKYIVRLSKASEESLKKYGKGIVDQQYTMKHLADIAVDLFVGLCVLSRVTSLINKKSVKECQSELDIAKIFIQQAKRRMNHCVRRLISNEDQEVKRLCDHILEQGRFPWDTI